MLVAEHSLFLSVTFHHALSSLSVGFIPIRKAPFFSSCRDKRPSLLASSRVNVYKISSTKTKIIFYRISSLYSITHLVLVIALNNVSPSKTGDRAFIYPFPQDQNQGIFFCRSFCLAGFQSVCLQKLKYFTISFEP